MQYVEEVAGSHAENKDGTDRKEFIRKHLSHERAGHAQAVLVREMDNPHDKYAVAVYVVVGGIINSKSMQIGYLNRDAAEEVAYFMDSGGKVSNVQLQRVWIPHFEHVTPVVTISFDASWSEEDVEYWEDEQVAIASTGERQHVVDVKSEQEKRSVSPVGMKEVNQVYGWTPYVWLAVVIFIFWIITRA